MQDERVAEFSEICKSYGVPLGRANLIGQAIAEAIDKPHRFICGHCGKPDRSKDPRAQYCSDSCRVLACVERKAN